MTDLQPKRSSLAAFIVRASSSRSLRGFFKRAAFAALILAATTLASLEAYDRLGDSSPQFAWNQLVLEIQGDRSFVEYEALELLEDIARQTGLSPLRAVRVGLADGLGDLDFSARFNPTTFRLALNPSLADWPKSARRKVILHEIGHAVAFSRADRPQLATGDAQADEIVAYSLLSNQIFQESYADAFAAAWALRANPADVMAHKSLARALAAPETHSSPAHETTQVLRLLRLRLAQAKSMPAERLPVLLAEVASQASALTIASLGAEREAACYMGLRGVARYALDMGYESIYLPWEMPDTFPIAGSDPMAQGLLTLSRLRTPGLGTSTPWAKALSRARPAVEAAMAASKQGASPDQASKIARSGLAMSHQNALPRELNAAAFAARLTASTRTGWRASAAAWAMGAADSLLPSPTYGCSDRARVDALAPTRPSPTP